MVALFGRFEYVGELGEGATARVIRAIDLADGGKPRALKVVAGADGGRLLWEMSRLREVHDAHVAQVHELLRVDEPIHAPFGLTRGAFILVEDLAPGKRVDVLTREIREQREAWLQSIVKIGLSVAEGLSALHGALLVHGDVKPANVIATHGAERVTLIDLGMARAPGVTHEVFGTPSYLAPEAWAGVHTFSRDIYALGALLYDLLLVRDFEAVSHLGASAASRDAEALSSCAPRPLIDVVMRALSALPEARPESAMSFAALLASAARKSDIVLPARASRYVTGRVVFTPRERALRVLNGPWIGHSELRRELAHALLVPQVIAVLGPSGAGRTRLIREALLDAQRECVANQRPLPTLVNAVDDGAFAQHTVLHQQRAGTADIVRALEGVSAARRAGRALCVVLETEPDADLTGVHTTFRLPALLREEVASLLTTHLEREPTEEVLDAAIRASAGLAGRLISLLAQGCEEERELQDPRTFEALSLAAPDADGLSDHARCLLRRLSLANRPVRAEEGRAFLDDERSVARARDELFAKGLVAWRDDGLAIPTGIARSIRVALTDEAARADALRVEGALCSEPRSPWTSLLLGDHAEARKRAEQTARALIEAHETTRAVAFLDEMRTRLDHPALRVLLADALRALGAYGRAASVLDGLEEVDAILLRAELLRLTGQAQAALGLLDVALALHGPLEQDRAQAIRARTLLDLGDGEAAVSLAQAIVDRRSTSSEAQLGALEVLALALLFQGKSARFQAEALVARARALRSSHRLVRALSLCAEARRQDGQNGLALDAFREALLLAEELGTQHEVAALTVNLGVLALDTGELATALERLRDGVYRLSLLGKSSEVARALLNLANAAWAVGDVDAARASIEEASVLSAQSHDVAARAFCAVVQAELLIHHGEIEAARVTLETALRFEPCPQSVKLVVLARAAIVSLEGPRRDAARNYLENAEKLHAPKDLAQVAEIAVARTRLLLADGLPREAEQVVSAALTALTHGLCFEAQVRLLFVSLEAARAAGRDVVHEERLLHLRALLERVMAGLSPDLRARMRNLPAYARVLAQAPKVLPRGDAHETHAWRRLVTGSRRLFAARNERALARELSALALELVHAERALVVVRREDGTLVALADTSLAENPTKEATFSRSVIERAWSEMVPLVTVDAQVDERLHGAQSVHSLSVRSVAAVPFRAFSGQAALYLDDRVRASAFGPLDTAILVDLGQLASAAFRALSSVKEERREVRKKGRALAQLEREVTLLRKQRPTAPLIGTSTALTQLVSLAERVARGDVPVLIRGESGTGKELVAKLIHEASERSDKPFVIESCAALPEPLLESALFGHVRGAFTGADRARTGLFEQAHGGTLFLDEVGEMSPALQAKLLRVLTDGVIRPLGSAETRVVDVRLVTATHRDLRERMAQGAFREDLYYRIAVVELLVPPLRDRLEDIPLLCAHFLEKHGAGRKVSISADAVGFLQARSFPGNVRQLEGLLRRALVLAGDIVDVEHLIEPKQDEVTRGLDLHAHTDALQTRLLRAALAQASGNQTKAAELLGLSRFGLQKMIKRLGVS